jgi:hypothetical protein
MHPVAATCAKPNQCRHIEGYLNYMHVVVCFRELHVILTKDAVVLVWPQAVVCQNLVEHVCVARGRGVNGDLLALQTDKMHQCA